MVLSGSLPPLRRPQNGSEVFFSLTLISKGQKKEDSQEISLELVIKRVLKILNSNLVILQSLVWLHHTLPPCVDSRYL